MATIKIFATKVCNYFLCYFESNPLLSLATSGPGGSAEGTGLSLLGSFNELHFVLHLCSSCAIENNFLLQLSHDCRLSLDSLPADAP